MISYKAYSILKEENNLDVLLKNITFSNFKKIIDIGIITNIVDVPFYTESIIFTVDGGKPSFEFYNNLEPELDTLFDVFSGYVIEKQIENCEVTISYNIIDDKYFRIIKDEFLHTQNREDFIEYEEVVLELYGVDFLKESIIKKNNEMKKIETDKLNSFMNYWGLTLKDSWYNFRIVFTREKIIEESKKFDIELKGNLLYPLVSYFIAIEDHKQEIKNNILAVPMDEKTRIFINYIFASSDKFSEKYGSEYIEIGNELWLGITHKVIKSFNFINNNIEDSLNMNLKDFLLKISNVGNDEKIFVTKDGFVKVMFNVEELIKIL